jgi:hypothetical protein
MGTVISHPFFSILKLLRFRELWGSAQPPLPADQEYDIELRKTIQEAYLEPFTRFESKDHLQAAMALTDKLQPAWRLFKWSQEIDDNEPESLSYYDFAHFLQRRAREVIGGEAG